MRQIIFLLTLFFSSTGLANPLIPYTLTFDRIADCKTEIKENTKAANVGWLTILKGERADVIDVSIVALDENNKVIYRFGDENAQPFKDYESRLKAAEKLVEEGICPIDSTF